ncbi:MAG TPA: alpha/beta fold hydrolase [Candidatus Limnocylindrales bacterium]|nr:alpha/beta fold hydrolase [Candidatus Limnocylindrales bacterium]
MQSWLRRWSWPLVPRLRLLTFPPAGGSALTFRPWAPLLPLDVELVAVELPGHGNRLPEPPVTSMSELMAGLVPELQALPGLPTAVLGHSMGAIVALAVCRRLRQFDPSWRPKILFVVGSEARASRRGAVDLAEAPTPRLRRFLLDVHDGAGGAAHPVLQDLVIPALRADLALLACHLPLPDCPLGCPIRVLTGADDDFVTTADQLDWAAESDGNFERHTFAGGHFFYADPAVAAVMLQRISADLNRLVHH